MGPAAVLHVLAATDVTQVLVCDKTPHALNACQQRYAAMPGGEKLSTALLDLHDQEAAVQYCAAADVIIAALPWEANALAIHAALRARRPIVGIARPPYAEMPAWQRDVAAAEGLCVIGCGLEPGLTEIMAHYAAQQLDQVEELHIRCGGVPAHPAPPLGYKIVFGGNELPLHDRDVYTVHNGQMQPVSRFSGVETLTFQDIGVLEAWFDGMLPWFSQLPALKGMQVCTQKTIRWPGFAAKVMLLKEMGLLSQEPVTVDGVQVVPKRVLDTVLAPHVTLQEGEPDLVLFRVEAKGWLGGQAHSIHIEMVDRYDPATRLTAMARTTGFTAASVARMIGRGELQGVGALRPEEVIVGPLLDRLRADLAASKIVFHQT